MVALDIALTNLNKSVDALKDQFKKTMEFADNAQKQALGLGLTFEQANKRLAPSIDGLRGSLDNRFQAGLRALEAGLQGNTKGVSTLINQQKLTDTALGKTAGVFAKTNSILQISNDANNELAISLIETGNKYGISTSKLVNAIDELASTFPAAALAGMGENVLGAVTQLQAELGPQLAGPLNQVMRMVMDTSMEGYERLTTLGIGQVREQLAAAKSASEAQQILKDAFVTASNTFKSVAGDASKGFYQIGIASEIFGEQAINLTTVADNLGKRIAKEGDQAADFGQTLKNLKEEILVPFQAALTRLYPLYVESLDVVSAVVSRLGERFNRFIDGITGSDEAFKAFKISIVDMAMIITSNLEGAFSFIKIFATEIVPNIGKNLSAAFFNFWKEGGVLDQFALQLKKIILEIDKAINLIRFGEEDTLAKRNQLMKQQELDVVQARFDYVKNRTYEDFLETERKRAAYLGKESDLNSYNSITAMLSLAAEKAFTNNKNSQLYLELTAIKENIENERPLRVQQAKDIEDINKNTLETPELPTVSSYLDETVNTIGRALERIIGVQGDNTSAEILDELRMQTPLLLQASPRGVPAQSDSFDEQ